MKTKVRWLEILIAALLFCIPVSGVTAATKGSTISVCPLKPSGQNPAKQQKTKKYKNKTHSPTVPKERSWGIWSVSIGAYLIIFAVLSAMFFLGFYYYLYLLALLGVILLFGIFMTVSGVYVIDRSYIHYSDHPDLKSERLMPQILREFIFAGLLTGVIVGLFFLQFYITAFLCLIAVFALITSASLKLSGIGKMKKNRQDID